MCTVACERLMSDSRIHCLRSVHSLLRDPRIHHRLSSVESLSQEGAYNNLITLDVILFSTKNTYPEQTDSPNHYTLCKDAFCVSFHTVWT